MNTVYIYTLSDPRDGKIRYVGKTKNLKQRKSNHLNKLHGSGTHKRNWISNLKKEGVSPIMEIIDEVSEETWKFWEKFWICLIKTWGYNLVNHTDGGDGLTFGNQTSFKSNQISWNKGKGNKNTCLQCGILFSINPSNSKDRQCCSRSCSTIYRKQNNLYKGTFKKNNISWNKGKIGYSTSKKGSKIPIEVREKISKTLTGRPSLKKRPVKQYDKDMTLINNYSSIKEAQEITGIKNIGNVLSGRNKTAGGFIWR